VTDKAGDVISSIKQAKPGPIAIRLRDGNTDAIIQGKQSTLL
jgi:hypothetical protein